VALAAIKAALSVKSIARGSIRIFPKDASRFTGHELQKFVIRNIAEDQETRGRPRGTLRESVARGYLVNPDIGKVLSRGASGQQE
jgi:hypothetical protein